MMPPPPPRAPRGPGVPSSSGRDYAAALAGRGTGRGGDESEEDEETRRTRTRSSSSGEDLETYLKHAGPNSYNILADRRRKAPAEARGGGRVQPRAEGQGLRELADPSTSPTRTSWSSRKTPSMFFRGAGAVRPPRAPRQMGAAGCGGA